MSGRICCVCHVPVGEDAQAVGTRYFCAKHYASLTRDRQGLWVSTAIALLGLLAFVVLVQLVVYLARPALRGTPLVIVGLVLAIVPALLWLLVFYLQDRLEPEPKGYVLSVFALGIALAVLVGMPVLRNLLPAPEMLGIVGTRGRIIQLLRAILIVGFVQEYLKYAAVRYSVYRTPEFDERVDGILYGAAAGLGFATALNVAYIISSGGALLNMAVIRVTIVALAQASFGGVMGYFLGRAKFENRGKFWLPAGLALSATLNGLVTYLLGETSTIGMRYTPAYGLVFSAIVALVTFVLLFTLIRRANAATRAEAQA